MATYQSMKHHGHDGQGCVACLVRNTLLKLAKSNLAICGNINEYFGSCSDKLDTDAFLELVAVRSTRPHALTLPSAYVTIQTVGE